MLPEAAPAPLSPQGGGEGSDPHCSTTHPLPPSPTPRSITLPVPVSFWLESTGRARILRETWRRPALRPLVTGVRAPRLQFTCSCVFSWLARTYLKIGRGAAGVEPGPPISWKSGAS